MLPIIGARHHFHPPLPPQPPLVCGEVDAIELQAQFTQRKHKEYHSKHRARLISQHPSGLLNFKTPQTSRLNLEEHQIRIDYQTRSIHHNRKKAIALELIKRQLGSKYNGTVDTSPVVIVKRGPKHYGPGSKHVQVGLHNDRRAQELYERRLKHRRVQQSTSSHAPSSRPPATSLCEQELFNVAARLSRQYHYEYKHWDTARSRTLQTNARIHLDRSILHHYSTRTAECEAFVHRHRLKCQHRWMLQTLTAWHAIATKR